MTGNEARNEQLTLPLETFEDEKQLEFFDRRTGDIILRRPVAASHELDTQSPYRSTSDEPRSR